MTAAQVGVTGGSAAPYWQEYTYDASGAQTSRTLSEPVDAADPVQVEADTDGDGLLTVVQELGWDGEGELAGVSTTGEDAGGDEEVLAGQAEYVYTAGGDRLVRTDAEGTTVFLPGGQEVTVTDGAVAAVRYYSFAGQMVASRNGNGLGGVTSLVCDHHGSVMAAVPNTDWTPDAVNRVYTDPYGGDRTPQTTDPDTGETVRPTDELPGDRRFLGGAGGIDDSATGLVLLGARYYDTALGRFISVDPVMDLTDPQQWHGYTYSHNNPITFTDPTGKREICDTGHTCNYGKSGRITKQKKKPRSKRTIWDIRSAVRSSYTSAQPFRWNLSMYSTTPYFDATAARLEVRTAKLAMARANAAAARARAEQERRQAGAVAEARLAEQRRRYRGTPTGAALGDIPSAFIVRQNGPFVGTGTTLDDLPDQINVELYAGGCEGRCVDGAVGVDTKHGFYRAIAPGFGIEQGVSAGIAFGNGVSPGISYGVAGSASVYGPFVVTGSASFDNPPGLSGGGGIGAGMRYGGTFTPGIHGPNSNDYRNGVMYERSGRGRRSCLRLDWSFIHGL